MPPNTAVCRLCLSVDVRMFKIAGTQLQLVYEKLTSNTLHTADKRPVAACYICYARLKKCHKLMLISKKAENVLTAIFERYSKITVKSVSMIGNVNTLSDSLSYSKAEYYDTILPLKANIEIKQDPELEGGVHTEEEYNSEAPTEPPEISDNYEVQDAHIGTQYNTQVEVKEEDEVLEVINKEGLSEPPNMTISNSHEVHDSLMAGNASTQWNASVEVKVEGDVWEDFSHDSTLNIDDKILDCDADPFTARQTHVDGEIFNDGAPAQTSETLKTKQTNKKASNTAQENSRKTGTDKRCECHVCQYKLETHLKKHTDEKYECDVCQRSFTVKGNLQRHIRTVHMSYTRSHPKSEIGGKPFECNICYKEFKRKDYLQNHLRVHTGEKPYECNVCHRRFTDRSNLRHHSKMHANHSSDTKLFECNICQHQFKNKHHLDFHLRTHTGEKPYECDYCQRRFVAKSNLKYHLATHRGNKKSYKCKICQQLFYGKYAFESHEKTCVESFACGICKRQFNKKASLDSHLRTHTDEKPYECNVCRRKFRHKGSYQTHLRIHTGEKPFRCKVCQRRFNDKSNLNKHLVTHTT